jgi:hypothetical protein
LGAREGVGEFAAEVAVACICDGVHYRNSTEVGSAMGKKVGELAVSKIPRPGACSGYPSYISRLATPR